MELKTRNVTTAFDHLVDYFDKGEGTVRKKPYNNPNGQGLTLYIDEPVTITYKRPWERVLLNKYRDANPFFHLYESLWMLCGRNDVAPIAYYAKQAGTYSDDGKTLNGAYGYRWRNSFGGFQYKPEDQINPLSKRVDQLQFLIQHLKDNPHSRRAILQMWNVEDDLRKIGSLKCPTCQGEWTKEKAAALDEDPEYPCPNCEGDTERVYVKDGSKDVCCNLSVKFKIRQELAHGGVGPQGNHYMSYLDMTVFNRSNDLIWGCLGTNAVHFSVLQEYMAAHLQVSIGRYHQISDDLHVYDTNFKPDHWLQHIRSRDMHSPPKVDHDSYNFFPLIRDTEAFEQEMHMVVGGFKGEVRGPKPELDNVLTEPFLRKVACPMFRAYELFKIYRERDHAMRVCELIEAKDWREASIMWLKNRKSKNGGW